MTFYEGLGMFTFGMGAFFIGCIAVYYVINKLYGDKEWKPEYM